MRGAFRYLGRNPSLTVGIALLAALGLFVIIGNLLVDTHDSRPLSVPTLRPPSRDFPFGTDRQGRDLLAVMVAGTPLTLRIGFIAGFFGVGLGTVLGLAGIPMTNRLERVPYLIAVFAGVALCTLAVGWVEDLAARRRPVLVPA